MNEIAKEWVEKAENDFSAAELTLHGGETPIIDAVCFHSQQCAEKYLKAFLQESRVRFERRHELIPLLELCLTIIKNSRFYALHYKVSSSMGY